MARLNKPTRLLLLVLALVFVSIHLLSTTIEGKAGRGEGLSGIEKAILTVYHPVDRVVTWPFRTAARLAFRYAALIGVKEENERLYELVATLRGQIVDNAELHREVETLREFFDYAEKRPETLSVARVVGHSYVPELHTVLIDRGTKHGVVEGAVAVTPAGLVGHVTTASRSASRVRLITDPLSAVPVVVQRSRATGVVKGSSSGRMTLHYVKWTEDVKEGDLLVTSGRGVFPRGVAVGIIAEIMQPDPASLEEMVVEPAVDLGRLETVALLPPRDPALAEPELSEFAPPGEAEEPAP